MLQTMTMTDLYPQLGTETTRKQVADSTMQATSQTPESQAPEKGGDPGTKKGLFDIKGSFLGQPIMIWLSLIAGLVLVKFIAEKEND